MSLSTLEKLDICQAIIIDLIHDKNYQDIINDTGLSEKRCMEIEIMFSGILKEYQVRHSIWNEYV